jgi:serine/threonine protein kinase
VQLKETGEEFALKIINKKRTKSQKKEKYVKIEREILESSNNINIIHWYSTFEDDSNLCLILII